MPRIKKSEKLFYQYFDEWVDLYKDGAIRDVTLQKYRMSMKWVKKLAPELTMGGLDRKTYQNLLNEYAKTHEKQTVIDFHHQLKGAILDAVDDGLIQTNPTRKITLKGKPPGNKKAKFLNQSEVQSLLNELELTEDISWDWLIFLLLKTGLRFSEGLALTPTDFDFSKQTLNISKTWNYKHPDGGFQPTKNLSSNRKVLLDWQTCTKFAQLTKEIEPSTPIFIKNQKRVFNSVVNQRLSVLCRNAKVPIISLHSCRHSHASLLIFAGVSIASVAKRLGHSNVTTTQETYLHIIKELENQDTEKIMNHLASL